MILHHQCNPRASSVQAEVVFQGKLQSKPNKYLILVYVGHTNKYSFHSIITDNHN